MTSLHIDFETRSTVELRKTGVYVYAEDDITDVWCAAYAIDDEPVVLWTPEQPCPVIEAAVSNNWTIVAHNAAFERIIWKHILTPRYGWPEPKLEQWRCTMAQAYAMALPGALDDAAAALGMTTRKDKEGHRLMMQMAKPRANKDPHAPLRWWDDEDRRNRLYAYCKQDVEVERELDKRMFRLSPFEQRLWHLDQRINDRGLGIDKDLIPKAKEIVWQTMSRLDKEMNRVTGGAVFKCTNVAMLVAWLKSKGLETDSVAKGEVIDLLVRDDLPVDVRRALELRQEAAKASVSKLNALELGLSRNGRAQGTKQYHVATTGRWGGRRFQPDNLPRPLIVKHDDDATAERLQEAAVRALMTGRSDIVEGLYGPPLTIVADCIRGFIVAAFGRKLNVADYANIEGRVLAWLAGESWKLQAFKDYDSGEGPDLYKIAAAEIYKVPHQKIDKLQRQIGKVSELACGYQGGVGAFQTMAHTYGVKVPDEQAKAIVEGWRSVHPRIKGFWYDLEDAAIRAVEQPGKACICGPVRFIQKASFLFLQLPSSRVLTYPYPRIMEIETPWGAMKEALTFKTQPTISNVGKIVPDPSNTTKWARVSTYGGMLAENITQAVARDVMAEAMVRVEAAGYPVVLTVHDEVLAEPLEEFGSIEEFNALMAVPPKWADGLPITVDGWQGRRYRK